jgi:hypothetical protein
MADPIFKELAFATLAQTARNPTQDFIRATPRNPILGYLSDLAASSYSPQRTQQMQGVAQFFGAPAISQTLDRLSYGEPLTTGAGGLGGTTRVRPEAIEAAVTMTPMLGPAARMTKGLPVGMSIKSLGKIDELTGLPLNADGTVTLFHHTNKTAAEQISKTGRLKSAGEPSVYLTTRKTTDTGYGDVAVPVRVKPSLLNLDDEFPDGRLDFSIDTGKPKGSIPVTVEPQSFQAPQDEALLLAQQRAALPVEQGGLGLAANNTAQQRAAIMFPDEVFHGSKTPENIKKLVAGGESGSIRTGDAYGTGVYTTTDAVGDASAYGAGGAVFPLRINRSGNLQIDAPNADDLQKLSKFAGESMLPSDKARFAVGREKREFADVQDARDFFANQRENWNQFGGGYDRARPEALANPDGTFAVEFTNFDAPVPITSGKDADILLRATGYDNVRSLGYTGHTLDRGAGRLWDVTTDTDQLRSRFAAFDPFRRTAAIAATMGVAAPDLLAQEQPNADEAQQRAMIMRDIGTDPYTIYQQTGVWFGGNE